MNARTLGLLLPPAVWLVLFLAIPTAVVAGSAFTADGVEHLYDATTLNLFWRSLRISLLTTTLCLLLGYPLAYFIAGCKPRWRNLILFLVILPFWTNLLVRTYALMFLLRPIGFLYHEAAVVFGLIHNYIPFMVLPIYASLEKVPPRLLEASRDLGASPWRTFWSVTVPLTMPGIAAGCILVFIPVLGAFATPEIMGGGQVPMIGNQIDLYFTKVRNPAAGSALTLVVMAFTVVLLWTYYRLRKTEGLV